MYFHGLHGPATPPAISVPRIAQCGRTPPMALLSRRGRHQAISDTTIEVKRRANAFARLYDWLNDRDVLIGKANRQEPLVVLRMSLAAEIAKRTA